jgi:hypothetical protein
MSIKDYLAEVKLAKPWSDSPALVDKPEEEYRPPGAANRIRRSMPLLLCLAAALIIRTWLVIHTQGFINGDEALVGIQAEHILHGEFPIYFYGQAYMGSLEAYLVAIIFAIVGPSPWALRAEPILLSLAVVWLTWKLAAELADAAQLSRRAKRWFMTISALFAAIPPLYDTVLELTTLGGYIESFVLMLLLLISALKLTRRQQAGAPARELAWRWAGIGFIVGAGLWINPIIIYGITAAALWIVWDYVQLARQKLARKRFIRSVALPFLAALPACIIGLIPALIWGIRNSWQNITYMLYLSGNTVLRPEIRAHYPTRVDIFFGLVHLYTFCVTPRVISGALPGESTPLAFLHGFMLYSGLFCILATVVLFSASFVYPSPLLLRVRSLASLSLLFAACVTTIFCVTKAAAIGLWACQYDLAGRYATPLMLVLPFLFAIPFTALVSRQAELLSKARAADRRDRLTAPTASAQRNTERFNPPAPSGLPGDSVKAGHPLPGLLSLQAALGFLVGILLLVMFMQVFSYGLTDAGSTFQSPYCTLAPLNNDAIIAYMEREHIQYAWAPGWIAYPVVFKTQGKIVLADPVPLLTNKPQLNRIPANTNAVLYANRASILVFVPHTDRYPDFLRTLNSEQVTYRSARFPAQKGRDVIVVTPLNRTVSLQNLDVFYNIFVCSSDS